MALRFAVSAQPFDTHRGRRWWSLALIIPMVASAITVLTGVAAAEPDIWPPVPKSKIIPHTDLPLRRAPEPAMPTGGPPQAAVWPAPGEAETTVAGRAQRVDNLPVTLSAAKPGVAVKARVRVIDQDATQRAGVTGVLMSVTPVGTGSGLMSLGLDYSGFRNAVGADFGSRLRLVSLPGCALSTPDKPECRVQTPIASSRNDPKTSTVSAELAGPVVVAAAGDVSGPGGSFAASSLSPSGSWSVSGNGGGFTWSYPITAPPAVAGGVPTVGLSYNSSSVDGRTAATNNQPSWIGQGWDYHPGYVERTYRTCSEDESLPEAQQTGDLCWAGQIVTMNLNGSTSTLVLDDATKTWHAESDNGARIELLTGTTNDAHDGEHWRVTTQDGMRYHFGLNRPPGHTTQEKTNSAWTVRVYGPKTGDPCNKPSGFGDSSCNQAWRWNLDYVEDPHGGASVYYYNTETNYYGANRGTTGVPYIRGGTPKRVDYGLRNVNGSIYGSPAPAQIVFDVAERCLPSGAITCDPAQFTAANAKSWPDTPQDQDCKQGVACSNHGPSFWTTKRLTTITTQLAGGAAPVKVDSYRLDQTFPEIGDKQLWLSAITRTAHGKDTASSITLPPIKFTGQLLDNRVLGYNQMPAMAHWRVTNIATETGSSINVTYSQTECTATNVPVATDLENNTKRCYPVYWTLPRNRDPILDYFHKYVVDQVQVQDLNGVSPSQLTKYSYLGTPAWHVDDNELVKPKYRTYGQFRGYRQVETRTGDPANNVDSVPDSQTLTRVTYFRGMGGATPPNSLGETRPDLEAYNGMAWEEQSFKGDGGPILSTVVTEPLEIATTATRARTGLSALTATITGTSRTLTRQYLPGGGFRTATKTTRYDSTGRVTASTSSGDGVPDTCTTTKYAQDATGLIQDRASEVITSQQSCPAEGVAQTSLLSGVRTYYDSQDAWGALRGRGDVTRVDTATNNALLYKTTATAVFDPLGRPTSTTDALGHISRLAYTPAEGGILAKTVSTNPKGQATTTEYAPGRGAVASVLDPAGRRTDAVHDALGRVTSVWAPGQTKNVTPASITYAYLLRPDGPQAVTTKKLVDYGSGTNYVTSISLYDAFGQLRQTQTETDDNRRVVSDVFYDSHGWVRWSNNRYATAGVPETKLISVAAASVDDRTATAYDKAGRVTKVTAYKGTTPTRDTRTIYGGDRVTTIPPEGGITTTAVTDVRGQTTELRQYTSPPTVTDDTVTGGAHQTTSYRYTATGLTDRITDTTGNTAWTYGYDFLGRKTTQTDPDAGTSTWTYNLAGQTLTATDARNQTLTYEYDELGRKITEYTGTTKLASWVWDGARNGIGQLYYATQHTSSGNYVTGVSTYNLQGKPNEAFTSIPAAETGLAGFHTTGYTYTSTGQLDQITPATGGGLPGNDITAISYDKFGRPRTMLGYNAYVSSSSYTPFGEPSQYVLGPSNNTAKLTYDYDAQTRLLTQATLSAQQATPQIDDTRYTYDLAGNITRAVNTQGHPDTAPIRTECFGYDPLRRLNQAWTATNNCATAPTTATIGGPAAYWHSWTFDPNGLRTEQVQHSLLAGTPDTTTTYSYPASGSPRPHSLTGTTTTGPAGISTTGYDYDNVGNTIARRLPTGAQALDWDIQNRLSTVTAPGGTTKYVYDADGGQLIRRDPNSTTLFLPGQEFTRNNTTGVVTGTRYYGFNGTTVAIRVGGANPKYVASGLHGTASVTADSVGFAVTRRTMDPYGNPLGAMQGGPWPTARGFLDKPTSENTGLTDIGARKYDTTTGRFISVDPILDPSDPQSMTGYAYANNNPLAFSDPSGLYLIGGTDDLGNQYGVSYGKDGSETTIGRAGAKWGQFTNNPGGTVCNAKCRTDRHKHDYAPKTDDPNLLLSYWQTGADPTYHSGWSQPRCEPGFGCGNACFGRTGCHQAWLYILKHPGDIEGAKEIAAMYCVTNFDECAWEATKEEVANQAMFDVLTSLYGVAGGISRAGAGTAKAAEASAKRSYRCLKGGNSFAGDTLVLMADGATKPISAMKMGDMVLAADPETGESGPRMVSAVVVHEDTVLELVIEHDAEITTTEDHPFWNVTDRAWQRADQLDAGDRLLTSTGEYVRVSGLRAGSEHVTTAYNLTVHDLHTYYVSHSGRAVLVHNTCPEDGTAAGSPDPKARSAAESPDLSSMKKVNDSQLKKMVGDVHEFKEGVVGRGAAVSRFDVYVDKSSGWLFLQPKSGGDMIPTYHHKDWGPGE